MVAFSSLTSSRPVARNRIRSLRRSGYREVVIVDSRCDRYGDFIEAARVGEIGLHFCEDGRSALRLARQFRADCWLVNLDQPDMSGLDLLEMLSPIAVHGVVPGASRSSCSRLARSRRPAVFGVADDYDSAGERRALACGIAGYLVGPVTLDGFLDSLQPAGMERAAG
ncbi:MAG: hypothetical protein EBZ59_01780 [Planctomycetia bacterium]|nr:hypothetical protein [Planctomycetia bacterium]